MIITDFYLTLALILAAAGILGLLAIFNKLGEDGKVVACMLIIGMTTVSGLAVKGYMGEDGRKAYIEARAHD